MQAEVKTLSVGPGRKLVVPDTERDNVFLTVSGPNTLAEGARVAAHVGGLLLTRSSQRLTPSSTGVSALRVVTEQRVDKDWVSLLRRPVRLDPATTSVVELAANQPPPSFVPGLAALAGQRHTVVLVWHGEPQAGVPSVVEEVAKKPYAQQARSAPANHTH